MWSLGARERLRFAPYELPVPLSRVLSGSAFLLKRPPDTLAVVPTASRGDFVMMLTAPVSALAPHTAEAGPRTTSICFTSTGLMGTKSQMMNPNRSR